MGERREVRGWTRPSALDAVWSRNIEGGRILVQREMRGEEDVPVVLRHADDDALQTRSFVFTCPSCGWPHCDTVEPDVDVHSGAIYTCGECEARVVFEALTVEEYAEYARRSHGAYMAGFRDRDTLRAQLLHETEKRKALEAERDKLLDALTEIRHRLQGGDLVIPDMGVGG